MNVQGIARAAALPRSQDSRIFKISRSLSWCVKLSHSCRPMILDFPFLVKPNSGEIRISAASPDRPGFLRP